MSRRNKDWITSYLRYVDNTEPPNLYKEWVAVSVIASCLQRKCYLDWGPMTFYPNMYIVLTGPSGKARKSTAMGPGMKLLREMGVKLAAESITREALIRELKTSNATQVDPVSGATNFTLKAKGSWTNANLVAICPVSQWDAVFASQVDSVITNPKVQSTPDEAFSVPS